MIRIGRVPPIKVEAAVSHCRKLLEKAAEASPETPESLIALGMTGKADCWIAADDEAIRGVAFTQILEGPKGRELKFLALGGEDGMAWLKQARRTVLNDARKHDVQLATFIRIGGRKNYFGMKPAGHYYEERL